jgi:hypothetical protein
LKLEKFQDNYVSLKNVCQKINPCSQTSHCQVNNNG